MFSQLYEKLRPLGVKAYYSGLYPLMLKSRARAIGKKDRIEVVFFAFNLAMWRYQGVYDLLSKDKRFNCHIVFTVTRNKNGKIASELQPLREYFSSRGIPYVDYDDNTPEGYNVKELINPDILFYTQPYAYMYPANHDFFLFKDKLLCYIPYGFFIVENDHELYDLPYHNLAWKIYCPFLNDKKKAKAVSRNSGLNWVVSGYHLLDQYNRQDTLDVWKIKDRKVKRLIWAPHFTLTKVSWIEAQSNFLWMSQLMLDVAERYKDRLQIAFKPHPRLISELYLHPDWGKERTDNYYQRWASMENTQVETGEFVDLFKTSDAMIHDSGSFSVEYLFVNKPVAFVKTDMAFNKAGYTNIGSAALDQHYIVHNEQEVTAFIDDVVLGGNDPMSSQRTEFCNTVLRPDVTDSPSQFIVNDIKKGLGLA